MQALVYDGKQPKLVAHYPDPALPDGEALIRPTRMGVCATDLEICKGYMGFTGVLGHEFVGIVEQVASKNRDGKPHRDPDAVKKWVGRRVVGSINCVRTICDMCKAGLREHARDRTVLGILERDGAFADRFTLPLENLHHVPDSLDDDSAVFTEPLAAAYQILRQITIEGRPYVTVLGDGRLGLLCAQVLSQENATVRLIGKHPDKLEHCTKWGIKHRMLDEVGLRQDQDIVVDCTGSASGLVTAMQMVRPRGKIILKTTVSPPPPTPTVSPASTDSASKTGANQSDKNNQGKRGGVGGWIDLSPLVVHEIDLIGSRCGPFDVALKALAQGKIDVVSLISKRMKLADGVDVLRAADQPGVIKVLIEP